MKKPGSKWNLPYADLASFNVLNVSPSSGSNDTYRSLPILPRHVIDDANRRRLCWGIVTSMVFKYVLLLGSRIIIVSLWSAMTTERFLHAKKRRGAEWRGMLFLPPFSHIPAAARTTLVEQQQNNMLTDERRLLER
jgi:hypothetical protein